MDHKATQLLSHYRHQLAQRVFDERDLHGLFILLREQAPKGSPMRELGDFIAHRTRDRGAFQRFLDKQGVAAAQSRERGESDVPVQQFLASALSHRGVYSAEDLLTALNAELSRAGVARVTDDLADEVALCAMSLLQDVRFTNQAGIQVGKLLLLVSQTRVALLGQMGLPTGGEMLVTVLSVPNRFCQYEPRAMNEVGLVPDTSATAIRRDGRLLLEI